MIEDLQYLFWYELRDQIAEGVLDIDALTALEIVENTLRWAVKHGRAPIVAEFSEIKRQAI